LSKTYDNLKAQTLNSTYYNKARNYTSQAAGYVNEAISNSATVQEYKDKAANLKDKLVDKFDQWITSKVDQQKLERLSKAAKKQFWDDFINEVIDEEFDYTPSNVDLLNAKPALT
jgi:L-lactate utilization protein LutB